MTTAISTTSTCFLWRVIPASPCPPGVPAGSNAEPRDEVWQIATGLSEDKARQRAEDESVRWPDCPVLLGNGGIFPAATYLNGEGRHVAHP